MATLTAALSETPDVGSQIVFVTTDPARDTPDRLKSWLANFQRPIIGLTGTPEAVAGRREAALVTVAIAEPPGSDGSYTVGHAASVLVYGPDDTLVTAVPSGTTQGEWMDTPSVDRPRRERPLASSRPATRRGDGCRRPHPAPCAELRDLWVRLVRTSRDRGLGSLCDPRPRGGDHCCVLHDDQQRLRARHHGLD